MFGVHRVQHLPADKQFLATRNVPCPARAGALDNVVSDDAAGAGGGDGDDDDGDWLVSRILTTEELRTREERALEEGFDILDGDGEVVATPPDADAAEQMGRVSLAGDARGKQPPVAEEAESADEYADMAEIDADVAEFEDEGVTEDEAAVAAPGGNGHVMCRRYDVSITYDKVRHLVCLFVFITIFFDKHDSNVPKVLPDTPSVAARVLRRRVRPAPDGGGNDGGRDPGLRPPDRDGGEPPPRERTARQHPPLPARRGDEDHREEFDERQRPRGGGQGGERRRRQRRAIGGDVHLHILEVCELNDPHHQLRLYHGCVGVNKQIMRERVARAARCLFWMNRKLREVEIGTVLLFFLFVELLNVSTD